MGRGRGPGVQHTSRRREIADAVLAVVAERGLAAVTLQTVAAEAGISAGRVQHYFPTKEDLLEAAFERANSQAEARIRELVGTPDLATAPPRDTLTVVLTELVPHDEVSRTHLRVRQAFAALALHRDGIADLLRARYRHLHRHDLATLIEQDRTAGLIAATVDPVRSATGLAALADGLAYYVLIGAVEATEAREQLLAAIAELYR